MLIGFLPAHAQGDEEGTISTPASQAPYLPLQVQLVNVNTTQINPSKFPIIELYVLVTGQDGNTISGLGASNFLATEQSNLESQPTTETISVAPITATGNIAVALTIDRSGSMSGSEIADAKTAANTFVDNMATLDRAAIISFSSSVTINQVFTSDKTALHNAVNSLSASGGTAVYDAIYKAIEELTNEIGVKAVIIFTDGQSNSDSHSVQEAIDLAKDKGIPVYTIGLGAGVNESILQTIADETGGYYTYAPTAADLQQIYDDIAQAIRDQYLVTYSTHNPSYDGTTRTVEVTVTVGTNSDSDTETYTVTEPSEISLTQDILNLMAQAQYAAQTLTIGAIITDDVAVTQAKLFYRTSGSADIYKEASMSNSSNLYTADIPGSDIAAPGVDFYITASDGTLTRSSPQNNPATYPHQISILPNEAPVISHTPVTTTTAGTNVVISANVTDTTDYVNSVKLFYRTTGYVLYDSADMVSSSDTYVATIPGSKVILAGIDYYIIALDNHSVRTCDGTDVAPYHIDVTSGPINHPPTVEINPPEINQVKKTATFTWSGSDDTTPAAQLVYKHRLLDPDSPIYDWLPKKDEEWSSSTTATYPRPGDSHLPDGTYRFQVKAKDADEAVQPSPTTYKFTIGAGAPGTISGRVTDASISGSSNGIAGVVMLLDPDPFTYCPITLGQGYFSFSIPAGTYDVTASASGYSTLTKSVTVTAGETVEVNFALTEQAKVPVIVIPGIMGSELWKVEDVDDRERIWPDVAGFSLQDADDLALTASGEDRADVTIQEGDILRAWTLNSAWFTNVYGKLVDCLTEESAGYVEDTDLFLFSYDWRKNLSVTSAVLAKRINEILAKTGAEQVDIVAHSMGGLVARYYINSSSAATPSVFYQSAANVRKLILLATPSHGSPDALIALHPELGRGPGMLSNEEAQDLSANWPSAYQLLPTEEFFDLYEYIFRDYYGFVHDGNLVASTPAETWRLTYLDHEESNLKAVNSYLLRDAAFSAYAFHRELGSSLEFLGKTYIVAGSGSPTTAILVKKDPVATPSGSTPSTIYSEEIWLAVPGNGDQTVPLKSVTRLDTSGPLRIFHVDVNHSAIPNDKNVRDLVLAILENDETEIGKIKERRIWLGLGSYEVIEEQSLLDGSNEDQAHDLKDTSIIVIKSPVELHIYDSEGNHTGPDEDGLIETAYHTDYFKLASNTVAFIPMVGVYELELLGTGTGIFGLEIMEFDGESMMRVFSFEHIDVTSSSVGTLTYSPLSPEYPSLSIDTNGDGSIDKVIPAEPVNTPIGSNISIAFQDELVTVLFNKVTSAGHTVCWSVDAIDGLDPSFKAVSPFYFLSTSAEFTGSASISIQYDETDVPVGRESDLKLYRITGEDAIEDITQKLDQAANTVTGQTDGFSYFVVGYINASPETRILSPTTGGTVTGRSCSIQWQTTDPDTSASSLSIDLFYSTNNGSTWTSISSNETDDGAYDWNISALSGGEYWLKVVATDPEEGTSEALAGPFTISVFEGNIIVGPNPVTNTGTVFFYTLPEGTSTAKLMVFNVAGKPVFEASLNANSTRFPIAGTWNPVDQDGIPLANGPYVYVLIADGKAIGQGKMVIQR